MGSEILALEFVQKVNRFSELANDSLAQQRELIKVVSVDKESIGAAINLINRALLQAKREGVEEFALSEHTKESIAEFRKTTWLRFCERHPKNALSFDPFYERSEGELDFDHLSLDEATTIASRLTQLLAIDNETIDMAVHDKISDAMRVLTLLQLIGADLMRKQPVSTFVRNQRTTAGG